MMLSGQRLLLMAAVFTVATPLILILNQKPSAIVVPFVLKEVIEVSGICGEDHTTQTATYSGVVTRALDTRTNRIFSYGYVTRQYSVERGMDEALHPTVYHLPEQVSFEEIKLDTDLPKWQLQGVSDRGEKEQGLDSTCQLSVVKRGTQLPPMSP